MITVQVCVRICVVCQQVVLVTLFEVVARRVGPADPCALHYSQGLLSFPVHEPTSQQSDLCVRIYNRVLECRMHWHPTSRANCLCVHASHISSPL